MVTEDKGRLAVMEKGKITGLITRNGVARYIQIRKGDSMKIEEAFPSAREDASLQSDACHVSRLFRLLIVLRIAMTIFCLGMNSALFVFNLNCSSRS